jgi:hypothetical protein
MLTPEEIVFYREVTSTLANREGAIVDLGCWFGGSSIALAQGLPAPNSENSVQEKIIAFDLFIWEAWMPLHAPYCVYEPGESFLPEARRLTRDHAKSKVQLVRADLATYEWSGGPIKILVVDAMKSYELTREIARNFFPSLQTGSLLIQQDFKYFHTSWIHLLHYRLREYFRLCRSVSNSTTAAFEVLNPIPTELLRSATEFAELSDEEIDASFNHSLQLLEENERPKVAAAHVMHYIHVGRNERAREILKRYRHISDRGEFAHVFRSLSQ